MKRLQREGVGAKKRQAEVLTEANEELMWSKGLLEDTTPQSLLDTVVFYNGLFLFCIEERKEALTAEKLTLSNTGNRTPRREALSSLHKKTSPKIQET